MTRLWSRLLSNDKGSSYWRTPNRRCGARGRRRGPAPIVARPDPFYAAILHILNALLVSDGGRMGLLPYSHCIVRQDFEVADRLEFLYARGNLVIT